MSRANIVIAPTKTPEERRALLEQWCATRGVTLTVRVGDARRQIEPRGKSNDDDDKPPTMVRDATLLIGEHEYTRTFNVAAGMSDEAMRRELERLAFNDLC